MSKVARMLPAIVLFAVTPFAVADDGGPGQPAKSAVAPLPEDYSCTFCHGADGTLAGEEEQKHLIVTEKDFTGDVHWQKGLRCHDCHGGSPDLDTYKDHRDDPDFRSLDSPGAIPALCGRCHEESRDAYAKSVHYQSGGTVAAACSDCHGNHGMFKVKDPRSKVFPTNVVETCGNCHASIEYMRKFRPSPRTDQLAEYRTSGHGQRLEKWRKQAETMTEEEVAALKAPVVATCISCHHNENENPHDIRPVQDLNSPVYPTHVAETCARCHSNKDLMAGRTYHGRPLGHNQYELWQRSVHGRAMLEKGDLSAPTCNDCHGNHGAMPPGVNSVANACGSCHGKMAELFAKTTMKHQFEEEGLPGCAACHGNHQTISPSDELLGMEGNTFCVKCHKDGKYGATSAGAGVAKAMREGIDDLKRRIEKAQETIEQADRLGMMVQTPRYDLRKAFDALTNARSMIHTFSPGPVDDALKEGRDAVAGVQAAADKALADHTWRRVWLGVSLVPIFIVIGLLLLYIRTLPIPDRQ